MQQGQPKQHKLLQPQELFDKMALLNLPDDMIFTIQTIAQTLQMKEGILGRTLDFLRAYMEQKQLDHLELTNDTMDIMISNQDSKNQQINIIIDDDKVRFEMITKTAVVTG